MCVRKDFTSSGKAKLQASLRAVVASFAAHLQIRQVASKRLKVGDEEPLFFTASAGHLFHKKYDRHSY